MNKISPHDPLKISQPLFNETASIRYTQGFSHKSTLYSGRRESYLSICLKGIGTVFKYFFIGLTTILCCRCLLRGQPKKESLGDVFGAFKGKKGSTNTKITITEVKEEPNQKKAENPSSQALITAQEVAKGELLPAVVKQLSGLSEAALTDFARECLEQTRENLQKKNEMDQWGDYLNLYKIYYPNLASYFDKAQKKLVVPKLDPNHFITTLNSQSGANWFKPVAKKVLRTRLVCLETADWSKAPEAKKKQFAKAILEAVKPYTKEAVSLKKEEIIKGWGKPITKQFNQAFEELFGSQNNDVD